jgi:hypothetical protein
VPELTDPKASDAYRVFSRLTPGLNRIFFNGIRDLYLLATPLLFS